MEEVECSLPLRMDMQVGAYFLLSAFVASFVSRLALQRAILLTVKEPLHYTLIIVFRMSETRAS